MEKLQLFLEEVKEGKLVNEVELSKVLNEGNVTVKEIMNFINELKGINFEEAGRIEYYLAEHISGILSSEVQLNMNDISYSDIKKLDEKELSNLDTTLAEKMANGYEQHLVKQVESIDSKIEQGIGNIKEKMKDANIEEHKNMEVKEMKAEDITFEELKEMVGKAKLPFIKRVEVLDKEDALIKEAEDQIKEVGSMIKSNEDKIEISCIVGTRSKTLVDGTNCNIIPVQILNSAIITNIGLEVKEVIIKPEMESIEDLILKVQLYEGENITVHELKLEELDEAGLVIVVDSLTNVLEFTSVEFRGLTKMIDYGEIIQLINL